MNKQQYRDQFKVGYWIKIRDDYFSIAIFNEPPTALKKNRYYQIIGIENYDNGPGFILRLKELVHGLDPGWTCEVIPGNPALNLLYGVK